MPLPVPTYDVTKSYEENYAAGPRWEGELPVVRDTGKRVDFLGFSVRSRLGVPAGPLLNAAYTTLYARLGWDLPVYKTVRSVARACHPAPNCVYVHPERQLTMQDALMTQVVSREPEDMADLTITNSFGVPSREPKVWQADVEKANAGMGDGQVLIVSITGTPGIAERDLVEDFAYTAALAKEAGAKIIEANFSCPNVCTGEGDIYADPEVSARITRAMREAVGTTPLLIKIGMLPEERLEEVVRANMPFVSGFAGINTIPLQVVDEAGRQALPGEGRLKSGVCGAAIRNVSQEWAESMARIRARTGGDYVLVGVGGIVTEEDIDARLGAGMESVMSATAAMWDPLLALRWKNR